MMSYNVNIGSNIFNNTPCAVGFQEKNEDSITPFLHVKIRENDNSLQFSFNIFDKDGREFHVKNNIPVGINSDKIEVIHGVNQKIIKNKLTGQIILDIRKGDYIYIFGDFYFKGTHIQSDEKSLIIGGTAMSGNIFSNLGGILLKPNGLALGFQGVIASL